jgi:hypothetical protein
MGLLDLISGQFDLNTFAPTIIKEMKKSGAKSFVVIQKSDSEVDVTALNYNPISEIQNEREKLEKLKTKYLELVEQYNNLIDTIENGK